jgi:hypothetical protein
MNHDQERSIDLVHQDQPDEVIDEPSRLAPMVGRASTIRFGMAGTDLDFAYLVRPAEGQTFASQISGMRGLLLHSNQSQAPEFGSPPVCWLVLFAVFSSPRPAQGRLLSGVLRRSFLNKGMILRHRSWMHDIQSVF